MALSSVLWSKRTLQDEQNEWFFPRAFCDPEISSVANENLQQKKKRLWILIHTEILNLSCRINFANLGVYVNIVVERVKLKKKNTFVLLVPRHMKQAITPFSPLCSRGSPCIQKFPPSSHVFKANSVMHM